MSSSEAKKFINAGDCHFNSNRFPKAIVCYEKALKCKGVEDKEKVIIHNKIAKSYCDMKLFTQAISNYKLALRYSRSCHDAEAEFQAHGNLATLYKDNMQYDLMLPHYKSQLRLCSEDNAVRTGILYNLGFACMSLGKGKRTTGQNLESSHVPLNSESQEYVTLAISYFKLALASAESSSDTISIGRIFGCLGNCFHLLKDFISAIYYHGKRLEVAIRAQDVEAERRAFFNLGNAYVFLGKFEIAFLCFSSALAIAEKDGAKMDEGRICYVLGITSGLKQQYLDAVNYFLRYLNICNEISDTAGLVKAYSGLVESYKALGYHREVLLYAAERDRLTNSNKGNGSTENIAEILDISADSIDLSVKDLNSSDSPVSMPQSSRFNVGSLTELVEQIDMNPKKDDEEDLYSLIESIQSRRIDDQRTNAPAGIRL